MADVPPAVEAVSLMFCHHPHGSRRQYDGVEVCRECCSARSDTGWWQPVSRLIHADRSLRTLEGTVLYRDWYWSRLR